MFKINQFLPIQTPFMLPITARIKVMTGMCHHCLTLVWRFKFLSYCSNIHIGFLWTELSQYLTRIRDPWRMFLAYGKIPLAIVHKSFEWSLNMRYCKVYCSKISPFRHMMSNNFSVIEIQLKKYLLKSETSENNFNQVNKFNNNVKERFSIMGLLLPTFRSWRCFIQYATKWHNSLLY